MAAASAPPSEGQQPASSGCCFALGLFVVAIILIMAWAIHSESKSWEGY